ncbi:aldehyde reductase [Ornatilinea apprima]|uniref:Aldehyde reductase n=1 Tax=Ornatilinea apprima TaxID=1134406 RepID=A0A0P6XMM6_9CHLR|nr:iron-containing alcohol dehydrogenase [Ornatilinea apprima]KPL81101.1 aldehyde reductase [Ornatilinea apprima]
MDNFSFYNPTRIVFGKGSIANLPTQLATDQSILMLYGGGSIKKNFIYNDVKAALAGYRVIEFGGVPSNPEYEVCMQAADVVLREKIGFILAVGGGSVIDAAKFIAAVARNPQVEAWDIVSKKAPLRGALPIGVVLTLAATGSEMNNISVISRKSTQEKYAFSSDALYPQFSILDPQTTYTLPVEQIRNGLVDAFIHAGEQYMTFPNRNPLVDRQAEAIFSTLIEIAQDALRTPADYDARAAYMWCATQALNGHLRCGAPQDWATHRIGHELTALYGLAHAESLAPIWISLLRYKLEDKMEKLAQYGRRLWNLKMPDPRALAGQAIDRTEAFFNSIGMPTHLREFGVDAEAAAREIEHRFTERNVVWGENQDITPEVSAEIVRQAV